MKTLVFGTLLFAALAIIPSPLDTRVSDTVKVTEPVHGDIYVMGRDLLIDAPVYGDVVAAGGNVIINDSVMMDVMVAGGRVEINGYVGDDIRAAGGSIKISNTVKGDVLTTSGELVIDRGSIILGNLAATGGVIDMSGEVEGNVKAFAEELKLLGSVGGSFEGKSEKLKIGGVVSGPASIAANDINIETSALFENDIRFWNNEGSLDISSHSHRGTITLDPSLELRSQRWEFLGFASIIIMLWYLGTAFLMIWLIEFLFSKTFSNASEIVLNQTMKSLAYGLLYFIGVPVICLVLAITVLALPIGIIAMIGYIILAILGTIITAIMISNWVNRVYFKSSWKLSRIILAAFGIFVLLKLFTLTPVIGPLIIGIIVCMAYGAIFLSVIKNRKRVSS